MSIFYKISIDHVNAKYISGWCFHRFRRNSTVVLQCFKNNQLIAKTKANKHREDLKEVAIHPSGNCGFEFIINQDTDSDPDHHVSIRVKGSESNLVQLSLIDKSESGQKRLYHTLINSIKKRHTPTRTVVFMHIPKTAGTTFNTQAQSLFPKGSTITHIELKPSSRYRTFVDQYNYISGHLHFGDLKKHFYSENVDFYTIIREPYAQLHSHLKWLIQTAGCSD